MTSHPDHSRHLKELDSFFVDPEICRDSSGLLIHFSIRLAAVGHSAEVLDIVQRSPKAAVFQSLADGLRAHLGLPLQAKGRSRKEALQIASKITDEIASARDTRSVA
jgi:hypothetical protein